jgi:hypothetical protein
MQFSVSSHLLDPYGFDIFLYEFLHYIIDEYFGFNDVSSSAFLPNLRLVPLLHTLASRLRILIPKGRGKFMSN